MSLLRVFSSGKKYFHALTSFLSKVMMIHHGLKYFSARRATLRPLPRPYCSNLSEFVGKFNVFRSFSDHFPIAASNFMTVYSTRNNDFHTQRFFPDQRYDKMLWFEIHSDVPRNFIHSFRVFWMSECCRKTVGIPRNSIGKPIIPMSAFRSSWKTESWKYFWTQTYFKP